MRLRRAGTRMRRDDSTRIPTRVRVACTERTNPVMGVRENARTFRRGAVRRVRATTKCEACEISFLLLVDIDIERATRRVHPSM